MAQAFKIDLKTNDHLAVNLLITNVFEFHENNKSTDRPDHSRDYIDMQNKVNLDVVFNEYRLGGRFDQFMFFQDRAPCQISPKEPEDCYSLHTPEKLYLKINKGNFDFVAGDFYLTIGKGIALSIRKVDEFGLDTTLRGSRISYQTERLNATVAGGYVNTTNFDPVNEIFLTDPNEFFFAGSASRLFGDPEKIAFTLGAHYVYGSQAPLLENSKNRYLEQSHILGANIEFKRIKDIVDVFFETDVMFKKAIFLQEETTGAAFYASTNIYLGKVTIQLEGQYYYKFGIQAQLTKRHKKQLGALTPLFYTLPPSMERIDLDTQGDNTHSRGGRVRVDFTLTPEHILYVSYLFRQGFNSGLDPIFGDDPLFAELTPEQLDKLQLRIHHPYIGGEHHFGELVSLNYSIGWRDLYGIKTWRMFHADADITFKILPKHSVKLVGLYRWNNQNFDEKGENGNLFQIIDGQLAYSWTGIGSVAFLFSYSNEIANAGPYYYAVEAKINLYKYGYIKATYGATRGGLRCVSGVCRIFPAFEGFRTELGIRL